MRGLRRLLYNGSMSKENDRCELRKFNLAIYTFVENGQYYFITQSDGFSTCKSPAGMFEYKIPNDLKMVDTTIREYWNLGGGK